MRTAVAVVLIVVVAAIGAVLLVEASKERIATFIREEVLHSDPNTESDLKTIMGNLKVATTATVAVTDKMNQAAELLIQQTEMLSNITALTEDLHTVLDQIAAGKGTLGKLVKEDKLYKELDLLLQRLNKAVYDFDKTMTEGIKLKW